MSHRNPELIFLIGENGTGKTTYAKQLLPFNTRNLIIPANARDSEKAWGHIPEIPVDSILKKVTGLGPLDWELLNTAKHRNDKHRLMVFMHRVFLAMRGTYKILIPTRRQPIFEMIVHDELGFTDGLLHFDDIKSYLPGNYNPPQYIITWLGDRRMKNLDISLAAHAPNEIPALFFGKGPKIVLFRTGRSFKSAQQKIAPEIYEQLEKARAELNRLPKAKPTNGPVISPYRIIQLPDNE